MASHGPCRSTCLSQRSCWRSYRRRGLRRPLAGGLVASLSQRSCRRSYSEDEMASHGPCRSTLPLTALVLEVLQKTRPQRATCRRTCSWPLTALVPEVLQRR
eukprot:scaffold55111_cov77-Phaeocystis_antarctica.AAC.3